jgi:hypothetical protein
MAFAAPCADLRLGLGCEGLTTTASLGPSLPSADSSAAVGHAAAAEVRRAEGPFVGSGTRRVDSRAVHRQRQPTSNPPVIAAVLLHQRLQALPQQRKKSPGRTDQRAHQSLIGAYRRARQHLLRPTMRFVESARERAGFRPRPHDRQQDQVDWLPSGIAVKLQFVENSRIDNPSHGCQQRFSVERPRRAPAERILSRIHKPDSFLA